MVRLREIVFDSVNPPALARFWAAALEGYAVRPFDAAEIARLAARDLTPETDPSVAVDGPGPTLFFQQTREPKARRNRVHLDVEAADRAAEVARLLTLGATLAREEARFTVVRDPEGNELCVVGSDPATDAHLADVLQPLIEREGIFHRPGRALARRDLACMIDPAFVEIGASGRRYDREQVLDILERRREEPAEPRMEASEFRCIAIAADSFVLTYALRGERLTHRSSIWRRRGAAWQILFHQGTIVAGPE